MGDNALAHYSTHGPLTDPGPYRDLLRALPDDIPSLCAIVQGLMIHDAWIPRYGIDVDESRIAELKLFHVARIVARILELDGRDLAEPRPHGRKVIGCCRDFSTLLCAILREKGVPARARCGFARYFAYPGYFEDHWVCEYWDREQEAWIMADAQLDAFQRGFLGISFDACRVPDEQFVVGGRAWSMCRGEGHDPGRFGISDGDSFVCGLWFVRGNLVRDIAALNKYEPVPYLVGPPWKRWEVMNEGYVLSPDQLATLDRAARLSEEGNGALAAVRRIWEEHSWLRPEPGYRLE